MACFFVFEKRPTRGKCQSCSLRENNSHLTFHPESRKFFSGDNFSSLSIVNHTSDNDIRHSPLLDFRDPARPIRFLLAICDHLSSRQPNSKACPSQPCYAPYAFNRLALRGNDLSMDAVLISVQRNVETSTDLLQYLGLSRLESVCDSNRDFCLGNDRETYIDLL